MYLHILIGIEQTLFNANIINVKFFFRLIEDISSFGV